MTLRLILQLSAILCIGASLFGCASEISQKTGISKNSIYCGSYISFTSHIDQLPGGCPVPDLQINQSEYNMLQDAKFSQEMVAKRSPTYCVDLLFNAAYAQRPGFACPGADIEVDKAEYDRTNGNKTEFCRERTNGRVYKTIYQCFDGHTWISPTIYSEKVNRDLFLRCVTGDGSVKYSSAGLCNRGDRVLSHSSFYPTIYCKERGSNKIHEVKTGKCPSMYRLSESTYILMRNALLRIQARE